MEITSSLEDEAYVTQRPSVREIIGRNERNMLLMLSCENARINTCPPLSVPFSFKRRKRFGRFFDIRWLRKRQEKCLTVQTVE